MPRKYDQDSRPDEKLLKLYILLLFNDREYSLTELTQIINCSKQTIARLLDRIDANYANHLQERKQGRQKFYHLQRPSQTFRTAIDPQGLRQLALCRDLIAHMLPKADREALNISLQQAKTNLPRQVFSDYEDATLGYSLSKGQIDYDPKQEILHQLETCILERRCCIISYQKEYGGEVAERPFAPMQLVSYHDVLYCQGWLVTPEGKVKSTKSQPITFLVHRMQEVTIQRSRFSLDLPEPQNSDDKTFGIIKNQSFTVKIHFSGRVKTYICDRIWSQDQMITEHEDGSITLELKATSKTEILSFVLSFGQEATLLEPPELKAELQEQVKKMQQMYS
ncbi:MAG: WYL domain-containing protein [Succinivibrio sp.]|nr:WYL domain-containing protein [Succinivibrio sp.]